MKLRHPSPQILVGSLLILGLSAPQMRGLADEPITATAPIVVTPTPTATPPAKSESDIPALEPVEAVNLLEIFPVQEPRRKSDENTNAPDEATIAAKAQAGEVWVNSKSGVFHQAGTTHYGKTNAGFFLSEADALAQGYRGVKG